MSEAPLRNYHPARSARWGPWRLTPWPGLKARKLKVLFLHGFACSPRELRPLGQTLSRHGFEVMAPLLPGHGERYPGMNSCRTEDWIESVCLTFEALHRDGSPVAVLGYCLGGSLALATARTLNPRAVVCLATPVHPLKDEFFPPLGQQENEKVEFSTRSVDPLSLLQTAPFASDCHSPMAGQWKKHSCHSIVTKQFVQNYQETIKMAHRDLTEVRCPLAVVHSRADKIVGPEHAEEIMALVSGDSHQLIWSEIAGHALPIDTGRRAVIKSIVDFLTDIDSSETVTF